MNLYLVTYSTEEGGTEHVYIVGDHYEDVLKNWDSHCRKTWPESWGEGIGQPDSIRLITDNIVGLD